MEDSWFILYPFFRFSSFLLVALTSVVLLGWYQPSQIGAWGRQEVSGLHRESKRANGKDSSHWKGK